MVKQHAVTISDNAVLDQPTLRILQRRWKEWQEIGLPSCDQLLVDVLPRFNNNQNIVTVFGCSGHMEDEENYDNSAYIMFAANPEGISWLLNFHNVLICNIRNKELRCMIDISFGHAIFPMGDMDFTYPRIILRAHFNKVCDQFAFFAAIDNTLTHCGL